MGADTHAVLWYFYNDARLSLTVTGVMDSAEQDGEQIAISSITMTEMVYLIERGKIPAVAFERTIVALEQANATLFEVPFDHMIANVMRQIDRAQTHRPRRL